MNTVLIFAWIYAAMIATGAWESRVEGRNAFDKGKLGWKIHYKGKIIFTAYHFWWGVVAYPLMLSLPLVINGFDLRLAGILLSAYLSGLPLEDFSWFMTHPIYTLKFWNSKNVTWYPWFKIGKFEFPISYVVFFVFAIGSWYFLWK